VSQIGHGDIKSENVLITSSLWIYLTDFAPFKPVHLPLDDPWQFNYFFDSSARRTCYIAPERFVASLQDHADGELTEAMDLFSVGCILAELFCDGVPPFSLSQLFSYRKGEYKAELDAYLSQIEDAGVLRMVAAMLSLDPRTRLSAAEHLVDPTFPAFFLSMHEFIDSVSNRLEAAPVPATPRPQVVQGAKSAGSLAPEALARPDPTLKTNADARIDRLVQSWEEATSFLAPRKEELLRTGAVLSTDSVSSLYWPCHVLTGLQPYFPLKLEGIPNFEITMPESYAGQHPKIDGVSDFRMGRAVGQ
jgi:phosphoinositide-3-kinase regulatory subunit 4